MNLLVQSAMIFFGTLMAAGLVALGEPAGAKLAVKPAPIVASVAGVGFERAMMRNMAVPR